MGQAEVQMLERERPPCVFPIERGAGSPSSPSLLLSPTGPTGVKGPPGSLAPRRLATAFPASDASPDLSLSTSSLSDAWVTILFCLLSSCPPASGPQPPASPGSGHRPRFLGTREVPSRPGAVAGPEGGGRRIRPGLPALPTKEPAAGGREAPVVRHPPPCSLPSVARHGGPGPEAEVRRRGAARAGASAAACQASLR